jgi:hypothetical protein
VTPPTGYKLVLQAETASWVSLLFEVRDHFETWTDSQLFPLVQRQHLREGRRQEERVARYDPEALLVEVNRETAVAMAPGSRDALAAFYYVRTLRTEAGTRVGIPVHEAGSDLTVRVTDAGHETIRTRNGRVETTRLEVRIDRLSGGSSAMTAVVWLSRDSRRIPVVMDITTGFGALRAELAGYRPH